MKTYIALFRGINVGGKNILPMKALVKLLESLGYQDVRTYIQSGNLCLRSKQALTKRAKEGLSIAIEKEFGFAPKILFLEAAGLERAIANNPFPTRDGKALHFYFLESKAKASQGLARLDAAKSDSEQFELIDDVFYLYAPEGVGRSKLAKQVEKGVGVPATARNWNTVSKINEMMS